jgi:hypothetical protein
MKSVKKCVKYFVLITALGLQSRTVNTPCIFEPSQTEFVRHAKDQDSTHNSQLQIWSTTDTEPRKPGSLQACFLNFIRQMLTYYFKTGHYGFQATPCNLHFILQPSPCSFAINHPRKINLHNSFHTTVEAMIPTVLCDTQERGEKHVEELQTITPLAKAWR